MSEFWHRIFFNFIIDNHLFDLFLNYRILELFFQLRVNWDIIKVVASVFNHLIEITFFLFFPKLKVRTNFRKFINSFLGIYDEFFTLQGNFFDFLLINRKHGHQTKKIRLVDIEEITLGLCPSCKNPQKMFFLL